MILDIKQFNNVVSNLVRSTGKDRLNQQKLSDDCDAVLNTNEMQLKRRETEKDRETET